LRIDTEKEEENGLDEEAKDLLQRYYRMAFTAKLFKKRDDW